MGQATVTVTNIDFVDVISSFGAGAERYSTATFTIQPNPPSGITQNATGRLIVTADTDITFSFPAGSPCVPMGISHRQKKGRSDPCGKENFPKEHIVINELPDGSATIKIRNKCRHKGAADTFVWEVYIGIHDSAGTLGIIDPDIENQS